MPFWKLVAAIVVANIITGVIATAAWFAYWHAVASALEQELKGEIERSRQRMEHMYTPPPTSPWADEQQTQPRGRQQQQPNREQRARLISETRKLCDFWNVEFRRESSDFNRAHRDAACNRHREALNSR
ncbi:MAG: hypothetical protein LAT63_11670 [Marinobacter sp.]|nr:hypothetical protein [Marinobacter sp.]